MTFLAEMNAFSWLFDHRNVQFSFVKSLSDRTVSDKLWQNLLRYWHEQRCTPDLSVGVGISVIAFTLAGSGSTTLSVSLCCAP